MSNYVQFVVCQHIDDSKKYLFYAPAFSNIEKGDEILVDTQFGERMATVLAVCISSSEDVERSLRVLAGVEDEPIKRVIGKYQFVKFDYSGDENNG